MLQILLLTALCYEAYATVSYEQCLDKDKKYAEEALACDDVAPENVCKKLYAPGTALAVGKDDERNDNCFKSDTDPDEDMVKTAADLCPKTCGLCCKTAAFDCEDDKSFDCESVKKEQCKDPWKTQLNLVDKCPKTCGLCTEKSGGCEDKEKNCNKDQCKNTDFQAAMKVNCKKTCGFCDEESTTPAADTTAAEETTAPADQSTAPAATTEVATTAPCVDDPRCDKWRQNGFCTNTLYPDDYKRKYCGKMCGKC